MILIETRKATLKLYRMDNSLQLRLIHINITDKIHTKLGLS